MVCERVFVGMDGDREATVEKRARGHLGGAALLAGGCIVDSEDGASEAVNESSTPLAPVARRRLNQR